MGREVIPWRCQPMTAGSARIAPKSRPAATSSVDTTRALRRAIVRAPAPLGGVPGELHLGRVALIRVAGRAVELDVELVAVLLAAGERAERDRGAHRGERAAVLD